MTVPVCTSCRNCCLTFSRLPGRMWMIATGSKMLKRMNADGFGFRCLAITWVSNLHSPHTFASKVELGHCVGSDSSLSIICHSFTFSLCSFFLQKTQDITTFTWTMIIICPKLLMPRYINHQLNATYLRNTCKNCCFMCKSRTSPEKIMVTTPSADYCFFSNCLRIL